MSIFESVLHIFRISFELSSSWKYSYRKKFRLSIKRTHSQNDMNPIKILLINKPRRTCLIRVKSSMLNQKIVSIFSFEICRMVIIKMVLAENNIWVCYIWAKLSQLVLKFSTITTNKDEKQNPFSSLFLNKIIYWLCNKNLNTI